MTSKKPSKAGRRVVVVFPSEGAALCVKAVLEWMQKDLRKEGVGDCLYCAAALKAVKIGLAFPKSTIAGARNAKSSV